jgi:hypothetical protein
MNCPYCNTPTKEAARHGYNWRCGSCKIYFRVDEGKTHLINFDITLGDKHYELIMKPLDNKTRLIYWEPYAGPWFGGVEPDLPRVLLDLDTLLNVNPDNLEQKLKTLLMFL